jgi:adenylate cyclase, class 2
MASKGQEIEVKFYLGSLEKLEERLKELGAEQKQPRVHEVNLRFDTPQGQLTKSSQVLRLRKDTDARLTYKGPGSDQGGASRRQELEFQVSDFDMAQALFEALGYRVYLLYEKYRTTYSLGPVEVTLDEMPYGFFAEIEGPDGASIQKAAVRLGLSWDRRVLDSYTTLFDRVKAAHSLDFRDLTFENFSQMEINPQSLGVTRADSA